jgi:3-hexulose-6-phosphate synthase
LQRYGRASNAVLTAAEPSRHWEKSPGVAAVAIDKAEHFDVIAQVRGVADIIEIGTPLLKRFGIGAIATARELCPDTPVLADTKTVDAGDPRSRDGAGGWRAAHDGPFLNLASDPRGSRPDCGALRRLCRRRHHYRVGEVRTLAGGREVEGFPKGGAIGDRARHLLDENLLAPCLFQRVLLQGQVLVDRRNASVAYLVAPSLNLVIPPRPAVAFWRVAW